MIDGPVLTSSALSGLPGIRHGFFTRVGGASTGLYSSLNCGLGSNDEPPRVIENRDRVARHLGAASGNVNTVYQVHSAVALAIDRSFEGQIPKADALVTRTPGVVVAALAADCAPILFADPEAKVVAAAHAGWRGALGGIVEATVVGMERLGASRMNIKAAIGPCIHQENYEVGAGFEAQFLAGSGDNARFFATLPGKRNVHFDLPGFVAGRLRQAGIVSFTSSPCCTYADPAMFYSYRRTTHHKEPDYGRQISAIVVA